VGWLGECAHCQRLAEPANKQFLVLSAHRNPHPRPMPRHRQVRVCEAGPAWPTAKELQSFWQQLPSCRSPTCEVPPPASSDTSGGTTSARQRLTRLGPLVKLCLGVPRPMPRLCERPLCTTVVRGVSGYPADSRQLDVRQPASQKAVRWVLCGILVEVSVPRLETLFAVAAQAPTIV